MHTYPRPGWWGCVNAIIHTVAVLVKRLLFAGHGIRRWAVGVSSAEQIPVLSLQMTDVLRINSAKSQVVVRTVRSIQRSLPEHVSSSWAKKETQPSQDWIGWEKPIPGRGNSCIQNLLKQEGVAQIPGTEKTKVAGVWQVRRIIWDEVREGAGGTDHVSKTR